MDIRMDLTMANGAPMPGIQIKVTLNVIMYPGIGDL
jgi:hypothetical protein